MDARLSAERPDAVASKRTSLHVCLRGGLLQLSWPIDLGTSEGDPLMQFIVHMGTLE